MAGIPRAFIIAQRPSVDDIEFDICESESHKATARVTEHEVEKGADAADHIRQQLDSLDLTVRVTNTPIISDKDRGSVHPGRAEQAHRDLLKVMREARPVRVATSVHIYPAMAIVSVGLAKNAQTGQALSLSVGLRELRIVGSETITVVQVDVPRAQKNLDDGAMSMGEPDIETKETARTRLNKFARKHGGTEKLLDRIVAGE